MVFCFYSTEIIITSGPTYNVHSETLVLNTLIIGKLCVSGDDSWKGFCRFSLLPPLRSSKFTSNVDDSRIKKMEIDMMIANVRNQYKQSMHEV